MLKELLAVVLVFLLSPLSALAAPPPGPDQRAGQISALVPAASRNDKPTKAKDDLSWNDLLKTEQSGRLRASLTDGSTLSMGAGSQMRVVQHNAASQQTSLEMNFGRLRSRVVKLTQPGSKFEVKTPHAVIGAIGTDFYLEVTPDRTIAICYSGIISITLLQAAAAGSSGGNATNVNAGQMAAATAGGLTGPEPTPLSLQQSSLQDTQVPDALPGRAAGSHALRNFLIGMVVTGAAVGVGIAVAWDKPTAQINRDGQPPPQTLRRR